MHSRRVTVPSPRARPSSTRSALSNSSKASHVIFSASNRPAQRSSPHASSSSYSKYAYMDVCKFASMYSCSMYV